MPNFGFKHSQDSRKKMSSSHNGIKNNTREQINEFLYGR